MQRNQTRNKTKKRKKKENKHKNENDNKNNNESHKNNTLQRRRHNITKSRNSTNPQTLDRDPEITRNKFQNAGRHQKVLDQAD